MGTVRKSAIRKKPLNSGGSRKGIPNKSTANAREAIARFVDGNSDRLQGWREEIAADEKQGPREAFRCLMEVMEYHVPKLARTVVTGDPDHPQVFEFRWQK
jgi:hypothetical protein